MREQGTIERFPALDLLGVCRAGFVKRIPGTDVFDDKAAALERLETAHRQARTRLEMKDWPPVTAEQVHGDQIAVINAAIVKSKNFPGCDGFVTNQRRIALSIYVADCCAVYIVDPKTPAAGLVHSGKRGTEGAIVSKAIAELRQRFGSNPASLIVQLSPCIRPPHYEVDFAAQIREQARASGVLQIHDCGICTACDLDAYYSYRAEKGKTGRMLAVLGLM
jgi:copper oxidase (laccase) domain-containing protein